MDILIELLEKIRETPIIYIGKKSATLLKAFIDGYMDRELEINSKSQSTFCGFSDFVVSHYNVCKNPNWDRIITAYTSNDDMAFEEFYRLLDEYLSASADGNDPYRSYGGI